jgi:uncharacterized membrane protein
VKSLSVMKNIEHNLSFIIFLQHCMICRIDSFSWKKPNAKEHSEVAKDHQKKMSSKTTKKPIV